LFGKESGVTHRPVRIFYFAYSSNKPTGGQKCTYRHVDILNRNGFDAYIFHETEGFRLTWFDNDTRVIGPSSFSTLVDPRTDIVVLPEDLLQRLHDFPCRKVIFNKGIYHGFRSLGTQIPSSYPYCDPSVIGAFVVSGHNNNCLRKAFPQLRIWQVSPEVDVTRFRFRQWNAKARRIACAAKNLGQLAVVYHTVAARAQACLNSAGTHEWVVIEDKTESEVADILSTSQVLLFLSVEEGLPRLILEGWASGCITVTYSVGPLSELAIDGTAFSYGDHEAVVDLVEEIASGSDYRRWEAAAILGHALAREYSPARQERETLAAWAELLGEQAHASVPETPSHETFR
jgi:hypothetical protein